MPVPNRIIPAYAGSTAFARLREAVVEDHPRIRGEHCYTYWRVPRRAGSSPHTRGALAGFDVAIDLGGIIPAYAGSTGRRPRTGRSGRDHPRIRGEHPLDFLRTLAVCRIIPAYAGSTDGRAWRGGRAQDHPRIRGEHGCRFSDFRHELGSSPHTRGARPCRRRPCWCRGDHPRIRGEHRDRPVDIAFELGIIPAYAGSTGRYGRR